jgi:holo-[acyl-carrier protein] synthase
MAVVGVGIDAVDVVRLRRVLARRPSLRMRLFTDGELAYADQARDPTERLAARFAAKEAAMKALGRGIGVVRFVDVEVMRSASGRPGLVLHGTAAARAAELGVVHSHVSLTHTATVAEAVVVLEGP